MGWIQTPDRALAALLVAPGGGSDRHPHDTPRPVLQCRVRLTCLDGLISLKMEHDYKSLLSQHWKVWPGCQICLLLCLTLSDT